MELDPITLEILNNRLREIVSTMEYLLFHSGYSTILRESYDGSAGICDVNGHTVMASGAPYHLVPYSFSVQAILRNYPAETMRDGDSFILTDPYSGGNLHVPDLAIITPTFVEGKLIGFCVSIAHKTDLGGLVPGSSGAASREIFHEGLLLPGVRYWTKDGGVVTEIENIIKRNSRAPDTVAGDIRAQVGCTKMGVEHVRSLCAEYGLEAITSAFRQLMDLSEQRMRAGLARWADGVAEAEAWVDHDGVNLEQPLRLHVKVTKRGDEVTIDYSGMNEQVRGPINLRPQHGQTAALLALLAHLDPTIPINHGALRPVTIINPEGRLTNARWPAPCNSYYGLMHAIYSTVQKALGEFDPSRAVGTAGFGSGALAAGFRHVRVGKQAILYELMVTSLGGTPEHDGTYPVQPMSHATPSTPIEIIETEFPIRVLEYQWTADSAGAGRYRGGPGFRKEYQVLEDAPVTVRCGHQFKYPGWGVLGGLPPSTPKVLLQRDGATIRSLGPLETMEMSVGDSLRFDVPGGGGCGDPRERAAEEVLEDVLNGYVSFEAAERDYGVAIDAASMTVDTKRTAALRRR